MAFWAVGLVGLRDSAVAPVKGLMSLNMGLSPYGDVTIARIC